MDRRSFLRDAAKMVLVMPFGTFLLHCGGDDTSGSTTTTNPATPATPDTSPPDAPPQVQGENVIYTSNQVELHSHSFTVAMTEFTTPTDLTGDTTVAQSHTHSLTITATDFQNAANGQTVKIPTSSTLGHLHIFTIVKV